MSRALNKLNVRQVASFKEPGRYSDGGGLYLRVSASGGRSWVFMTADGGKRKEIGMGAASALSLAAARQLAEKMREAAALGHDPRAVLNPVVPEERRVPTFGEFAEEHIAKVEEGWKNPVHRQQWRNSLRDHAAALKDIPVDQIGTDDVLAVLEPIWTNKQETAKRVRGRIEHILDAAKARKWRAKDSTNPAAYKGHLAVLLPKQDKSKQGHHPALAWQEAPTFMNALRQRTAVAARCLEFVILTAARSGEALGATWGEIDLEQKLWTIPKHRMKAKKEHVVPLSDAALALLQQMRPEQPEATGLVFAVSGTARSNMAMAMLLRRMGRNDITTHGFRSTFRDWAGEKTEHAREIIEHALAHTIQSKSERSYRRETAVDRRRVLMEDWASYLHRL